MVVAALFACSAMGIGAYGIGSGTLPVPLLSAAFIALGFALTLTLVLNFFRNAATDDSLSHLDTLSRRLEIAEQASRDLAQGQRDMSAQLTELRNEAGASSSLLTQSLDDIRRSHAEIAAQLSSIISMSPQHAANRVSDYSTPAADAAQAYSMTQAMAGAATEEAKAGPSLTDRILLALEPIIDLYTMQTAHYRMIATIKNGAGQDVSPESLLHHATQTGERANLDSFVLREALGVLTTLRQRDGNLCVIANIGAATLADPLALRTILNSMAEYRDVSAGLVVEISHAALASLPESSLEGLATLARAGVTLALGNASVSGVDLAALSKLNVRHVSLLAASLASNEATLGGFVQAARALRIQVIVTHVADARQLQGLARSARYACGPAFAPPRKLKRVENNGPAAAYNAAA